MPWGVWRDMGKATKGLKLFKFWCVNRLNVENLVRIYILKGNNTSRYTYVYVQI